MSFTPPTPIDAALPLTERIRRAYERIADVDRPEVWITLRTQQDALADALEIDRRYEAGEQLPLRGVLVAVKDNIDVAGLPTTAGCPEYARVAERSAVAVQRLTAAGAIILGKTNLDQFATGLVGTRSPYGAVRCAWDSERVSGGSSSGSATAEALGIADIALGTDTAGSGRVPAALNGLVGIKPTLGLIPAAGVVPACVDYDAVTVFGHDLELAARAVAIIAGGSEEDPRSRVAPSDVPLSAGLAPRLAIPRDEDLAQLAPEYAEAFARTVAGLVDSGLSLEAVDISPLLNAATLLYDGAIVAQRYAAVGEFLETRPAGADPTVAGIVLAARKPSAHAYVDDLDALAEAKSYARRLMASFDALLLPTTTEHPTIAAVQAEPVDINRRMGTFTNFCNLLDMAAVAVPGQPTATGHPFGVMVVTVAFHDEVALEIAGRICGAPSSSGIISGHELFVVGAHLRGEPLYEQLTRRGARYVGEVTTSDAYRLVVLDTVPLKPGLVRHGDGAGAPIAGELYELSASHLATLLAELPYPMALGAVELADGRTVTGFSCALEAAVAGTDITEYGGWKAYLAHAADVQSGQ